MKKEHVLFKCADIEQIFWIILQIEEILHTYVTKFISNQYCCDHGKPGKVNKILHLMSIS